jgi:hypothetical protein
VPIDLTRLPSPRARRLPSASPARGWCGFAAPVLSSPSVPPAPLRVCRAPLVPCLIVCVSVRCKRGVSPFLPCLRAPPFLRYLCPFSAPCCVEPLFKLCVYFSSSPSLSSLARAPPFLRHLCPFSAPCCVTLPFPCPPFLGLPWASSVLFPRRGVSPFPSFLELPQKHCFSKHPSRMLRGRRPENYGGAGAQPWPSQDQRGWVFFKSVCVV